MKIILLIIYLVCSISGLIFMKLGGNPGAISIENGTIGFSMHWISAIGFMSYLISFLLFTRIVVIYNLSYIYPIITGIVQVITLVASKFILKESLSIQGIIGASIIIIGIIVMNLPKVTQ